MIANTTVKNIYREYLTGISMNKLSKKYHADIPKAFKRFGYKTFTSAEANKIFRINKINLNWKFESIKNQKEAYIIGLLMADGYVSKNQIGLRLKESDKNLVEQIKNYFSEEIKLQKYKNTYSFVISSTLACENIQKLGVYCHKTYKETNIPTMDNSLLLHFIRGYFDGDGTVFKCKNGKYTFLRCNICSPTVSILSEIKKVLELYNINCKINKENRKGKLYHVPNGKPESISNCDMYRLYINSREDIKRFFDLIYKDAEIFLKRKFDIFDKNKKLFVL